MWSRCLYYIGARCLRMTTASEIIRCGSWRRVRSGRTGQPDPERIPGACGHRRDESQDRPQVACVHARADHQQYSEICLRGERVIRFTASEEEGRVKLSVEDNGIGIAAEDLPRVFEKSLRGRMGGPRQPRDGAVSLPETLRRAWGIGSPRSQRKEVYEDRDRVRIDFLTDV